MVGDVSVDRKAPVIPQGFTDLDFEDAHRRKKVDANQTPAPVDVSPWDPWTTGDMNT